MSRISVFISAALLLALLMSCTMMPKKEFVILSGSENKSLEPLIKKFGDKEGINFVFNYKGSVDIMLELAEQNIPYDAIWPANSIWITLGDRDRRIKHIKSIMSSPVVFGIRKSRAQELGFMGKTVYVNDILSAIREKKLQFLMTSATQSNSGASAYIGFLYALAGNPEILNLENLQSDTLRQKIGELLGGINRSSGSSGWLKDLFLTGGYDAMVNYESVIIETNQELVKRGEEPLHAVYPVDGIVLSDSPLGFVAREDKSREEIFLKLQTYLLSDQVQAELKNQGRRTGFGGVLGEVDKGVFNPDWGIETNKILSPITMPSAAVIQHALYLYQTEFRKPSLTVFCIDFSGSMHENGERELKQAMRMLLDQAIARRYLIQSGTRDRIVVIPFSEGIMNEWDVTAGDTAAMSMLLRNIEALASNGRTDIYSPVIRGLEIMAGAENLADYTPAVILMTDGESNTGQTFHDVKQRWEAMGRDIPVFSILFGEASEDQLAEVTQLTKGRVFDGRHNLVDAFRSAKGYN